MHPFPLAVIQNIALPMVNPVEPSLSEFYFFRDKAIPPPVSPDRGWIFPCTDV
jgi:hypothetical protein